MALKAGFPITPSGMIENVLSLKAFTARQPLRLLCYSAHLHKKGLSSPNALIGDPAFGFLRSGFPISISSGMT